MLGYLAGLIDGEGTITIGTVVSRSSGLLSHMLTLGINGTEQKLMHWLSSNVGGAVHSRSRGGQPHWKPLHYWKVNAVNAAAVLTAVRPLLVIKGEQADVALRLRALGGGRGQRLTPELVAAREACRQELAHLNRRGLPILGEGRRHSPQRLDVGLTTVLVAPMDVEGGIGASAPVPPSPQDGTGTGTLTGDMYGAHPSEVPQGP